MRIPNTGAHPDGTPLEPLDLEAAIDTRAAAKIIGLAEITLHQMRARGEGPKFFRPNRRSVRFRLGDVLEYRNARVVGGRGVK